VVDEKVLGTQEWTQSECQAFVIPMGLVEDPLDFVGKLGDNALGLLLETLAAVFAVKRKEE
jgi:hypothetical protein